MIVTLYRILKIIKKKQFNKNFGKRVGEAMIINFSYILMSKVLIGSVALAVLYNRTLRYIP